MDTRQPPLPLVWIGLAVAIWACGNGPTATADENCNSLPTEPASARVDLVEPAFSNPTNVTNPLFPVSSLHRVILLGNVDGVPLRVETTLMPRTRTIELDDGAVEALESQYVAWIGRELHEVALDWYAQDDAGAVWYLGEDVFNYEGGVLADTEGTWLAGGDVPAAMIMPATPRVGDVWRPENLCGVVFEEVTAKTIGVVVTGPRGTIQGALVTDELHMDGTREDKTFAPGYGEFSTGGVGGNLEAVALAIPVDALPGTVATELVTLSAGADSIFHAAHSGDWTRVSAIVGRMNGAWNVFRAGNVPPMLKAQMDAAMASLNTAATALNVATTRQASIDVDLASLDLQLRQRPHAEIDVELLDVWARQLQVDAAANNQAAVLGDAASLRWIRDRLAPDVAPEIVDIDAKLQAIRGALRGRDLVGASAAADQLRATIQRRSPSATPR